MQIENTVCTRQRLYKARNTDDTRISTITKLHDNTTKLSSLSHVRSYLLRIRTAYVFTIRIAMYSNWVRAHVQTDGYDTYSLVEEVPEPREKIFVNEIWQKKSSLGYRDYFENGNVLWEAFSTEQDASKVLSVISKLKSPCACCY